MLYVGFGRRLTNCSWCKNLYHRLSTSRTGKIILVAFMGNVILSLQSLAYKWDAWLARFRCCANYSTAFYYRFFFFVLCCSSWHQAVMETGLYFSESVQECLCGCKSASNSQKGYVFITKIALFPVPFLCTNTLNMVSALVWSLW